MDSGISMAFFSMQQHIKNSSLASPNVGRNIKNILHTSQIVPFDMHGTRHDNRIQTDSQFRCAPLPAGHAERYPVFP